jgi:perosamine synthetase
MTYKYQVSRPDLSSYERKLLLDVFNSGQITSGPMVERFEKILAYTHEQKFAVATSSGTTALHLALAALGVGPGDEVIVPDLTYVATAYAVMYTGARPVLVDVNPDTWGLDIDATKRTITRRTRAIIPVHLYGVPTDDFTGLNDRVAIIEDAAEALYSQPICLGDMSCFSFYGNKLITTGEGGAVVTNNPKYAMRLRSLRGMAQHPVRRYYHTELGFNYRMTDLQAALGVAQLARLDEMWAAREKVIAVYKRRLFHLSRQHPRAGARVSPWLFTALVPRHVNRDMVMGALGSRGIETRPTFVPLHTMPEFNSGEFPTATEIGTRGFSLPTHPGLTEDDAHFICDEVLCLTT